MRLLVFAVFISLVAYQQKPSNYRSTIDLSGEWQFALDTGDIGIKQNWYADNLSDAITALDK